MGRAASSEQIELTALLSLLSCWQPHVCSYPCLVLFQQGYDGAKRQFGLCFKELRLASPVRILSSGLEDPYFGGAAHATEHYVKSARNDKCMFDLGLIICVVAHFFPFMNSFKTWCHVFKLKRIDLGYRVDLG